MVDLYKVDQGFKAIKPFLDGKMRQKPSVIKIYTLAKE